MEIHSHSMTFNSKVWCTNMKDAQELIIKVYEILWRFVQRSYNKIGAWNTPKDFGRGRTQRFLFSQLLQYLAHRRIVLVSVPTLTLFPCSYVARISRDCVRDLCSRISATSLRVTTPQPNTNTNHHNKLYALKHASHSPQQLGPVLAWQRFSYGYMVECSLLPHPYEELSPWWSLGWQFFTWSKCNCKYATILLLLKIDITTLNRNIYNMKKTHSDSTILIMLKLWNISWGGLGLPDSGLPGLLRAVCPPPNSWIRAWIIYRIHHICISCLSMRRAYAYQHMRSVFVRSIVL